LRFVLTAIYLQNP